MTSPLAFRRAYLLVRGVDFETDSIRERMLSDYFGVERRLRFLETKMNLLAIRSLVVDEDVKKLQELETQYAQLLFPELRIRRKKFEDRGDKAFLEFFGTDDLSDKSFKFGYDRGWLEFKGLSTQDRLNKRIAAVIKYLKEKENANP